MEETKDNQDSAQLNKDTNKEQEFCPNQTIPENKVINGENNINDNKLQGKEDLDNKQKEKGNDAQQLNNKNENTDINNELIRDNNSQLDENIENTAVKFNNKLRNTMTGLNNNKMRYESGLINTILKVEKDNVNHYLKGELAELYEDISKSNFDFKKNVFLPNVDYFEKKTGILDKNPIVPYNSKEDISRKLETYPKTNEIINKFTEKTKSFTGYC